MQSSQTIRLSSQLVLKVQKDYQIGSLTQIVQDLEALHGAKLKISSDRAYSSRKLILCDEILHGSQCPYRIQFYKTFRSNRNHLYVWRLVGMNTNHNTNLQQKESLFLTNFLYLIESRPLIKATCCGIVSRTNFKSCKPGRVLQELGEEDPFFKDKMFLKELTKGERIKLKKKFDNIVKEIKIEIKQEILKTTPISNFQQVSTVPKKRNQKSKFSLKRKKKQAIVQQLVLETSNINQENLMQSEQINKNQEKKQEKKKENAETNEKIQQYLMIDEPVSPEITKKNEEPKNTDAMQQQQMPNLNLEESMHNDDIVILSRLGVDYWMMLQQN